MKKLTRKPSTYIIIVLATLMLWLGGRFFLFNQLERGLVKALEEFSSEGLSIHYESLNVNFWKGNLLIRGISLTALPRTPADSSFVVATITELHADGISASQLLLKRRLSANSLVISSPSIHYKDKFNLRWKKHKTGLLKGFQISRVQIDSCNFEWKDRLSSRGKFGLTIKELQATMDGDSITWDVEAVQAKNIQMNLAAQLYSVTLKKLSYDGRLKNLQADSLSIMPSFDRMEFAKRSIHQIDQISFHAPSIRVTDLRLGDDLSFSARNIALAFHLEVFRDRRYPIAQRIPSVLPVEFLRRLPFALHIDSISLLKSYASYEERPAGRDASGKLYFDDLQASIQNISTDSVGETRMKVNARFMGDGLLSGVFTFPLENNKAYQAHGELSHFSMIKINDMLMAVGNLKIESGELTAMKFDFHYNDQESHGTLEMRYTDLQVLSIRKDKAKTVKNFATFLINSMIRNNLSKTDAKARRTGEIAWKRDHQKGVLNYWWKSVLSGIKAVLGLEKK